MAPNLTSQAASAYTRLAYVAAIAADAKECNALRILSCSSLLLRELLCETVPLGSVTHTDVQDEVYKSCPWAPTNACMLQFVTGSKLNHCLQTYQTDAATKARITR